jgi:Fic family protein
VLLRDDIKPHLFKQMAEGNLQRQYDLLRDLVSVALEIPGIRVNGDIVNWLHLHVTVGLVSQPGVYRDHDVRIGRSLHQPPPFQQVQAKMGDLFVELHRRWDKSDEYSLAAFALWRLCWIHPYEDGNGRTARAVAFMIICLKLGGWLPGRQTILEKIKLDGDEYKNALQHADTTELAGLVDLIPLATLLSRHTVEQLSE